MVCGALVCSMDHVGSIRRGQHQCRRRRSATAFCRARGEPRSVCLLVADGETSASGGIVNQYDEDRDTAGDDELEFPEEHLLLRDHISPAIENPEGEPVLRKYIGLLLDHPAFGVARAHHSIR